MKKQIAFTAKTALNLSVPAAGQKDYLSPGEGGFGLRVAHTGLRNWTYITRIKGKGKQSRFNLGRFVTRPGGEIIVSLAQARDKLREVQKIIEAGGEIITTDVQRQASRDSFLAVAERFLKEYHPKNKPELRPATKRLYEWALKGEYCESLHNRPVALITEQDLLNVLDCMEEYKIGVGRNRMLSALRTMFKWAVKKRLRPTNPAKAIEPDAAEVIRKRHLYGDLHGNPSEIALLWRATDKLPPLHKGFVRLMLLTGRREGEVAKMRWNKLIDDKHGRRWSIPWQDMKTGEDKQEDDLLPICPMMAAVLDEIPPVQGHEYVFPSRYKSRKTGKLEPISSFSDIKEALVEEIERLKKAEPERYSGQFERDWRFHDIRRTVKTGLTELGISKPVCDAIAGHKGDKIDQTYDQAGRVEAKRRALLVWEEHLRKIGCEIKDVEKDHATTR